jgi:hypothetical protein
MLSCQARILNEEKLYSTKECGVETTKRISIDEGEAYMSICSCCIRRFIKRKETGNWFGWFDGDYPPEARVIGSKWYYDNVASQKVKALPTPAEYVPTPVVVQGPPLVVEAVVETQKVQVLQKVQKVQKVQKAQDSVMEELQAGFAVLSVAEKKEDLRRRIKEIQKVANPSKMTLKEIQAAFKQITDLKAQIHML